MVSPDFARSNGVDLRSFAAALTQTAPWQLGPTDGLRLLRPSLKDCHPAPERAEGEGPASPLQPTGIFWGGCLALLTESLGTPYAPRPQGGILFLEDVTTKPYQWDRMLLHLRYAGLLDGVEAIVFGDMRQCVPETDDALLDAALLHALRDFPGPICIGLRSGHVDTPKITLPLGIRTALDTNDPQNPTLHLLESAVTNNLDRTTP